MSTSRRWQSSRGSAHLLRIVFSAERAKFRRPALFIDRDGVINRRRPGDYVLDWSQFIFVPGIRTALKQLSNLGLPMIIISNQAAVGKGLLDSAGLEKITARMRQSLLRDGVSLYAAYYCTHRSEADCACRKPRPGLLLRAAHDLNIDLGRSIFVGDSETDLQAAQAAGCQPVLFGRRISECPKSVTSMVNLPIARTARELFHVAVKCLRDHK